MLHFSRSGKAVAMAKATVSTENSLVHEIIQRCFHTFRREFVADLADPEELRGPGFPWDDAAAVAAEDGEIEASTAGDLLWTDLCEL